MSNELPANPTPEPAPRPYGTYDLRTLAAARRLAVDDPMFTAPPGTFRLQLFTADGARPVAVATQMGGEEGMSLMNGAETYAGAVWERHCPDEELPPVWVERQLWPDDDQPALLRRVAFAGADRYRPSGPRWTTITDEQLQNLLGTSVDRDRGAGYVPRPAEPEPELVFAEYAVTRLARPKPFREPGCMPDGVSWWRRWTRQLRPLRAGRSCCWYHGGDWHTVNAMARRVLRDARTQSVDPEDMREFAVAHAGAVGATDWQTQALATLFSTADAIQPDSEGGYINGQHRSQAMLEAGVRRTVVLRHVYGA